MQTYYTLDNMINPFKVTVDGGKLRVYEAEDETLGDDGRMVWTYHAEPTLSRNHILRVLPGRGDDEESYVGNTVLVEVEPRKYMYIGHDIVTFRTPDDILEYHSPVGPANVPYPYAVGEQNVYLPSVGAYFKKSGLLEGVSNPLIQFYDREGVYRTFPRPFQPRRLTVTKIVGPVNGQPDGRHSSLWPR